MAYIATVLADLPASGSFWKQDEASGTLVDSGGGAHNGTAIATPDYRQTGPLASELSYALGFVIAENEGVGYGDVFEFTGTQAYSLELWIKPTASAAAQNPFLLGQNVANTEGWNLRLLAAGTIRSQRFQAAAVDACTTVATALAGSWTYIVQTYDGANMTIYLNAVLAAGPTASANSIQANAATLTLGRFQTGGNAFDGSIAQPAIYPGVALSPATISSHFASAQAGGAPVRPVMMWP